MKQQQKQPSKPPNLTTPQDSPQGSLLLSLIPKCKAWRDAPTDSTSFDALFTEVVEIFVQKSKEARIRPAIYLLEGVGYMAYSKQRCTKRYCNSQECTFAMSELECMMHPMAQNDSPHFEGEKGAVFSAFMNAFTSWVNKNYHKVWQTQSQSIIQAPAHEEAKGEKNLPTPKVTTAPRKLALKLIPKFKSGDRFIRGGTTYDQETDVLDYKGLEPERGVEGRIQELEKHILAFLNKGKGSMLLGVREVKLNKEGRCWQAVGFHRMYLDKIQGSISSLSRSFLPKHRAVDNFEFIAHPMCDEFDKEVDEVVLEMRFERKADCKFDIFVASSNLAYYERTPGESPRMSGAILTVVSYYDKKMRDASSQVESQEWKEVRDQTLREIDTKVAARVQ